MLSLDVYVICLSERYMKNMPTRKGISYLRIDTTRLLPWDLPWD